MKSLSLSYVHSIICFVVSFSLASPYHNLHETRCLTALQQLYTICNMHPPVPNSLSSCVSPSSCRHEQADRQELRTLRRKRTIHLRRSPARPLVSFLPMSHLTVSRTVACHFAARAHSKLLPLWFDFLAVLAVLAHLDLLGLWELLLEGIHRYVDHLPHYHAAVAGLSVTNRKEKHTRGCVNRQIMAVHLQPKVKDQVVCGTATSRATPLAQLHPFVMTGTAESGDELRPELPISPRHHDGPARHFPRYPP
jgi:hypothetical protein